MACVLCQRLVDNGSSSGICNAHGSDEVREYRLYGRTQDERLKGELDKREDILLEE